MSDQNCAIQNPTTASAGRNTSTNALPANDPLKYALIAFDMWDGDAATEFATGFITALKLTKQPCPVNPDDSYAKLLWVMRQLTLTSVNPEMAIMPSSADLIPTEPSIKIEGGQKGEEIEFEKACKVATQLPLNSPLIQKFLFETTLRPDDPELWDPYDAFPISSCIGELYLDPLYPTSTFTTDEDIESAEVAKRVKQVRFVFINENGLRAVIRSDDQIMMRALLTVLIEQGDQALKHQLSQVLNDSPYVLCPYKEFLLPHLQ